MKSFAFISEARACEPHEVVPASIAVEEWVRCLDIPSVIGEKAPVRLNV